MRKIYDPVVEYSDSLEQVHYYNAIKYFQNLVNSSGVSIEKSRSKAEYFQSCLRNKAEHEKTLRQLRIIRVILFITVFLIPVAVFLVTPEIRYHREKIEEKEKTLEWIKAEEKKHMNKLVELFSDKDALLIAQQTLPFLVFDDCLTAENEDYLKENYGFDEHNGNEESVIDVLSGRWKNNPFVFERVLRKTETYQSYSQTEIVSRQVQVKDEKGKITAKTETESISGSCWEKMPFYKEEVRLRFFSRWGQELSFERKAGHWEKLTQRQKDKIQKMTAISLSKICRKKGYDNLPNILFESFFGAADKSDDGLYAVAFDPFVSKTLISLAESEVGYGDDFDFSKKGFVSTIVTEHSRNRQLRLHPEDYKGVFYDEIRESFINKNVEFFKALYFDFAPVAAVSAFEDEEDVSFCFAEGEHSLSFRECEALVNCLDKKLVSHPESATSAILKTEFISGDEITVTAYSFGRYLSDESVWEKDSKGKEHCIKVDVYKYYPLQMQKSFLISSSPSLEGKTPAAQRRGLYLYEI